MKKIIVIGCPGSGKSTFARELHSKTGIPLYYHDMLYWNSDKTTVSRETLIERMQPILEQEAWIIDGNYLSTMPLRIKKCDTVFFLDYPTELCLDGVKFRIGKPRPDMPWIETEEDREFIEYIKSFSAESRPKILELLEKHSDKTIYIFKTREQSNDFLKGI